MTVHGSRSTYVQGCRCEECTTVNRTEHYALIRQYKLAPKSPDDPRHGTTNFYTNYGCR